MNITEVTKMEAIEGRSPQPIPLKILKGRSTTKDIAGRPIPAVPCFERGVPDAPPWLSDEAREVWEATAPELDSLGSLKIQDGLVFTALCETWATYAAAIRAVREQGIVLLNPETGHAHKNPLLTAAEVAGRDLLRFAAQFGLTPVAEVSLAKPAKPDTGDDDPFGA